MKKNRSNIILILIFLVGLSVMLYPTISDYVNQKNQSRAVASYSEEVENLSDVDYQAYFDAADDYNRRLAETPDAFYRPEEVSGYTDTLDVSGTGIMGYITISKIGVELPVYHGTIDNIIGVVHEKDFYLGRLRKDTTLEDLVKPTLYTTGSTQISQLLRTLREQHHHMAVVVDEYGGTEGIITLEDILEALGSNLSDFFHEEEEHQIVFGQQDFFVDEQEGFQIEWIVPNAQKNQMESIILTLAPHQKSREVSAFQGEEFGYVLKGSITIVRGKKKYKVKAKETFYMDGSRSHYLYNHGSGEAKVLWITNPPMF